METQQTLGMNNYDSTLRIPPIPLIESIHNRFDDPRIGYCSDILEKSFLKTSLPTDLFSLSKDRSLKREISTRERERSSMTPSTR